jgi:CheY-like chemotaxis protein
VAVASAGSGQGATFTVRLPAIEPPGVAARPLASARNGSPETVLVVEDNADARASLCTALELLGHRVLWSADGPAGIELARRERPRVAVLDIGLPGMDGHEVARRLRAELGREIVLVALTGYGAPADEERAARAGFDRYLTKPVDVDELARVLEQAPRTGSPA